MKYVFTQFAAESRFLSRQDCITAESGYEDYLSDNGYSYTPAMFVHDAYYKWRYIIIYNTADISTNLPYAIGDEIYFVLGRDLDKFKETALKADGNNFKFVEKSDFYDWALYNGDSKLKKIADNYLKNTKCSYVQFKDLNVGEVFKLPNRDFLYIKLGPVDTDRCRWDAAVLTGDKKGHIITLTPEANVERCIDNNTLKDLADKYLKDDKDSFMTYGGIDYNKIANDTFKYTPVDVLHFLELCQNYKEMSFPLIKKVIFNKPATIVIWADGSKTVVKCQKDKNGRYEKYDKEKGLALCYMKKALGNKYDYYGVIKNIIETFG